jgi:two-component system, chemotaxis family, chemotaxis protein CheY
MRVLLVDDSAVMRKILARSITKAGYAVDTFLEAADGQQGLDVLGKEGKVDLILSDWNMPIMDGLEFVEEVRNGDDETKDIPIVMVTTEGGDSKVAESVAAGANGHVKKPFTAEDLQSALGKFLS